MDTLPRWWFLHVSLLLACCLNVQSFATASDEKTDVPDELHLFSGGLLFHLTPLKIREIPDVPVRPALGLGGGMSFYIGKHLRAGGMGESSAATFGDHRSSYRSFFGAGTVHAALPLGPVELALGVVVGGQGLTVFHLLDENASGTYEIERHERSGFILLPSFRVELEISRKVRLLFWAHYHHPHWLGGFNDHAVTLHFGPWFNTYVPRYTPPPEPFSSFYPKSVSN